MHLSIRRLVAGFIGSGVAILVVFAYFALFGAPQKQAEVERFIIPLGYEGNLAMQLESAGFIKSTLGFRVAVGIPEAVRPGAYRLSNSMSAWQIARVLKSDPYMKWIVIPEGYRKEQIAELLANALGWSEATTAEWVAVHTAPDPEHTEGVYFPDTYLISSEEDPANVAERLRDRFNEIFAPYLEEALRQNIRWPTLIKIASIVQREAAGTDDMPLIAGILWNRLLDGMKLDIDATLQYARGNTGDGWWAPITAADKRIDSPYNTYTYAGLPPTPISNPGTDAIKAVLFPEETSCFYYLHDATGTIHCAETYAEHLQNIEDHL